MNQGSGAAVSRGAWRLLLLAPRAGAENMARDEGLMGRARETGETVFSVYEWNRATLSLGRNQAARGLYDLSAANTRGVDIVRRPTGGRALLHNREVTYSVTAPLDDSESLDATYRRINRILIEGLARMGVEVHEAQPTQRMDAPGAVPCFAEPARGELVWRGRKLVGSAQVRERGALLQHGSILIEDDQPMIGALTVDGRPEAPADGERGLPGAATLVAALGRTPSAREVAESLFTAVSALEYDAPLTLDEEEIEGYTAPLRGKYVSDWWTWRR